MKQRLKTNGLIILFAVIVIFLFPRYFLRDPVPVFWGEAAKIAGLACIFLGQLFRASARGFKADYSLQGKALLTAGPYALVRNPMYLGIIMIGCGVVLVLFRIWVLAAFILIFITRYVLLTFKEEKKLSGIFGSEYAAYMKKVPRLMPSLLKLLTGEVSAYLPLRVAWLKKEIGTMVSLWGPVVLCASLFSAQQAGWAIAAFEVIAYAVTAGAFVFLAAYLLARTQHTIA